MTFDFLHHGVVRNVMIEKAPSSPESWKSVDISYPVLLGERFGARDDS